MERVENDNAYATPLQLVAQSPLTPVYDPETGELNTNTIYYNGLISLGTDQTTRLPSGALANLNAHIQYLQGSRFQKRVRN